MAPLLFTCPTTHRRAPTRIETDPNSLAAAWKKTLKVKCPHCGEVHRISVREAYITFAVLGPTRLSLTAHPECCLGPLRGSSRANQQNASTLPLSGTSLPTEKPRQMKLSGVVSAEGSRAAQGPRPAGVLFPDNEGGPLADASLTPARPGYAF
jgi:hypothetical protein